VQVLELADQIVEQNRSRIPDDAQVLLDHYLATLRRLTMQDEQLIKLCKDIYHKHRQAIDLIVEYGTASNVVDAMLKGINEEVDCEFTKQLSSTVWFLPKEMSAVLPKKQELAGWKNLPLPVPIVCQCRYWKEASKLGLMLLVGNIAAPDKRVRLMKAIQAAGFTFQQAGLKPETKVTRIVSCRQILKSNQEGDIDTSDESVRQVVATLWKKMWKEGKKIVGVLEKFDWS
jgi:hypothetical protein